VRTLPRAPAAADATATSEVDEGQGERGVYRGRGDARRRDLAPPRGTHARLVSGAARHLCRGGVDETTRRALRDRAASARRYVRGCGRTLTWIGRWLPEDGGEGDGAESHVGRSLGFFSLLPCVSLKSSSVSRY